MDLSMNAATRFRCMYEYCGRVLPLIAIEPELRPAGWSFVCPVCSHRSALANEGGNGLPDRFIQPDTEEYRVQIAGAASGF